MDYCVVSAHELECENPQEELERKVKELLNNGWKPQGGVSITVHRIGFDSYLSFAQALIKE